MVVKKALGPAYLVKKYPEMATIEGVIKHADLFVHT